MTKRHINGVLPHHESECPFCDGYVGDCEECEGEEPCEECRAECPHCRGEQTFRWGSFYEQDTGTCDQCKREETPICAFESPESIKGEEYICFDCVVLNHSLNCPNQCTLWEEWETIEQLFYYIEGEIYPLKHAQNLENLKKAFHGNEVIHRLAFSLEGSDTVTKKVGERLDYIRKMLEEDSSLLPKWDLPLSVYLFCMIEDSQKKAAESFLQLSQGGGPRTSWAHKIILEILSK